MTRGTARASLADLRSAGFGPSCHSEQFRTQRQGDSGRSVTNFSLEESDYSTTGAASER